MKAFVLSRALLVAALLGVLGVLFRDPLYVALSVPVFLAGFVSVVRVGTRELVAFVSLSAAWALIIWSAFARPVFSPMGDVLAMIVMEALAAAVLWARIPRRRVYVLRVGGRG